MNNKGDKFLKNISKILIKKPAQHIYEAFIDPEKIGNFWFSTSSERWKEGKTIILRYDEYNAEGSIQVLEMVENRMIRFEWGHEHVVTINFIEQNESETIVEVIEDGFNKEDENLLPYILDNKEGWVYMLCCLKAYIEHGVNDLRASLVK